MPIIKKRDSFKSIKVKTLSRIILILFFTSILFFISYFLVFNYLNQRELIQDTQSLEEVITEALSIPLWNLEDEVVRGISNSFFNNDLIGSLKVVDSFGNIYFEDEKDLVNLSAQKNVQIFYQNENEVGSIVYSINLSHHFAIFKVQQIIILILILLASFSVVATINFVNNQVIKRLKILQEKSKQIAEGDLNIKIDITENDEIGELADAFNKMTIAIKESRADVDKKIEDQTKDINKQKESLERQKESLERANAIMVNRELKMIELKNKIKQLKDKK